MQIPFDIKPFFRALARTTRFNPLGEDLSRPPSGPVARWQLVAIRSLLGVLYAVCAWILLHLGIAPLLTTLLCSFAVLSLHTFLTGGSESRLALTWFTSCTSSRRENNATENVIWQLQAMGSLLAPILLIMLQFHISGSSAWLIQVMALGAAGGVEYAASTAPGESPRSVSSWLLAAVLSALAMTCASAWPGHAFFNSLAISAIAFLLIPWLRKIPGAPRGFAAGTFIAEMLVLLLTMLLFSVA
jgi:hypothetical protein